MDLAMRDVLAKCSDAKPSPLGLTHDVVKAQERVGASPSRSRIIVLAVGPRWSTPCREARGELFVDGKPRVKGQVPLGNLERDLG